MTVDASTPPPRHREPRVRTTAERLHSAAIHLLRAVRREDRATGLSPARLSALSVIVFAGPLSLGSLAAAEQVRPPTMSRLVAALEEEDLVARRPDPVDHRITRIEATAAGRDLLRIGRERRITRLAEQLRGLSDGDLATLARAAALLERFYRRDTAGGGGPG